MIFFDGAQHLQTEQGLQCLVAQVLDERLSRLIDALGHGAQEQRQLTFAQIAEVLGGALAPRRSHAGGRGYPGAGRRG